jgi:hypothetical protein
MPPDNKEILKAIIAFTCLAATLYAFYAMGYVMEW